MRTLCDNNSLLRATLLPRSSRPRTPGTQTITKKPLESSPVVIIDEASRHIALHAGYVSSDLLYRGSQFRFPAPGYEDIRAFVHKLLGRRQADAVLVQTVERLGIVR